MSLGIGTSLAYLAAAVLFIFGIRILRSPMTARAGNLIAAVGMLVACVATLLEFKGDVYTLLLIAGVVVAGSVVGGVMATRVPMTSMPQFVAAFNGVGGGAAALISFSELYKLSQLPLPEQNFVILLSILFGILIGGVSFSGSAVAFSKLEEIAFEGSVTFPIQKVVNALMFLVAVAAGVNVLIGGPMPVASAAVVLGVSLLLGVLLVIPIGGADMPIVISLLNAFTGLAAAASGFSLGNTVLIIAGALVGASGTILTYLMSAALGRPLSKILFGAVAAAGQKEAEAHDKPVTSGDPENVGSMLANEADSVIFIPGYGLAVAQAQSAMADLMRTLEGQGKDVKFAIHPVAGRMPGHMNVLLAEARVPASKLVDLDDINDQFAETDAVIIVGANDVVNPTAREDGDSPIAGMPILNADHARRVVFVKRSLSPGFAGIDNPLFYDQDRTTMLFSDAKDGLEGVTQAVKNQG
ncbi:MAG: NAD(P)(+) transhydrogenase (Re/Si-specific) subunit beta [Thermoleophilaceae bacterium]|nr:NAD(P)(+) transhydrogenase (Re/Si-specific) subunit beta [Thermoleophilaceae bacterium]